MKEEAKMNPKDYISCQIINGPSKENISQYAQGTVDRMTMKAKMSNLTSYDEINLQSKH